MKQTLLVLVFIFIACAASFAQSANVEIKVFPNPATEFFSITDNSEIASFAILNVVGKKIKTFDFYAGEKYSIADLPSGLYLIQVYDSGREIITTQRLNKR